MGNYINIVTQKKIEEIYNISKQMMQIGQHFLILSGGIATGKTFFATEVAKKIVRNNDKHIHFFQFHEGYSYENFVHGVQIRTENQSLRYEKGGQPVQEIIELCQKDTTLEHVIIIDDLNRCNINTVLGDMLTALESSEVGNVIKTDKGDFEIPENLFIIATMNPMIGKESIDYAWFRRFTVIEMYADDCYFDIKDEYLKEYQDYLNYAGEIFRHVKMLFDLYFADSDRQREKELCKLGQGLFIQYDSDTYFKDNIKALHQRLKYIVAPLLDEYVAQGILTGESEVDIIAIRDLAGNTLKFEQYDCKSTSEKMKNLYDLIFRNNLEHRNAIFFFILHSANPYFQATQKEQKNKICLCEALEKALERNADFKNRKGGASGQTLNPTANNTGVDIVIEQRPYKLITGTGAAILYNQQNNKLKFYDKNEKCSVDDYLEKIPKILEKMNKFYKELEKDE